MRFDEAWKVQDYNGNRTNDEADRPLPGPGRHVATVSFADFVRKQFAEGTGNPDGVALRVKLDFGDKLRPVWDTIPIQWRPKITELCRSARVPPPEVGVEWHQDALVKRPVIVETSVGSGKNGDYGKVVRYLPQTDPVAPPSEPRPTPAAKPAPAEVGEDDIPF